MLFVRQFSIAVLWALVVAAAFFGLYGGWQATHSLWPGLHDDGVAYSTVVINRAAGIGNHFNVYTTSLLATKGDTEFIGHGQLYYPLAAGLLQDPNFKSFLILLHQANLFGYCLAFVVFTLAARRVLRSGWLFGACFGLAGACGTAAILQYLQGRPEHGIPFVLLGFALLKELTPQKSFTNWIEGIQIGLVAAMSPLPGALAGMGSVFSKATECRSSDLMRVALAQGTVAFATCLVATRLVFHGSMVEWLFSTVKGGAIFFPNPHEFILFWMKIPLVPGLLGAFVFAACVGAFKVYEFLLAPSGIWSKLIVLLCVFGLAGVFVKHGILWPAGNYAFMPFFPAVFLWCLSVSPELARRFPILRKSILASSLLVLAMLPGLGYLRTCLLQTAALQSENSYENTSRRIEELKSSLAEGEVVLISAWSNARNAVVFDAPPWKFRSFVAGMEEAESQLGFYGRYYLAIQYSDPKPVCPVGGNFELVEDQFNHEPVTIFGYKIKSSTPGYGYAIFERIEDKPHKCANSDGPM